MKPDQLFRRITRGSLQNVRFEDRRNLLEAFGFELRRVRGSHHVFVRQGIPELLSMQNVNGQAKPYQIRQFLRLVERYALSAEDRE